MRKRVIGKAFAFALTGAMVLTSCPVTGSIFNAPRIVKAAEQSDDYVYCYAGLTWNEYWKAEQVYAAGNTGSSNVTDSHNELDKGGYDAVTRATKSHGLHRGSFQCNTTIKTTDGNQYAVSYWKDRQTIVLTDGSEVTFNNGTITDAAGKTHDMDYYEIYGLKYVPVAVKASDYAAFKAKYSVVENAGTLVGGFAEGVLKSYSLTANVTKDTNGLKIATKNADGSFSFGARQTGKDSGTTEALQKAENVTATVKDGKGSYGEFLRVDLTGDGYCALGDKMQAVKWTYYGKDSTYKKAVATYGTKFAADNWMHKSKGIQLGLTDSIRCQLPKGYDGTGYWTLTVYALGYEDSTFNVKVETTNIAKHTIATTAEVNNLKATVAKAKALTTDDLCDSDSQKDKWADFQLELGEAEDALAAKTYYSGNINEAQQHLTAAMDALKLHDYKTTAVTVKATPDKDGSASKKCSVCGKESTVVINKVSNIKLAKTTLTYNKKDQKPAVTVKDSAGNTLKAADYSVSYAKDSKKPGVYSVKVTLKGNYSGSKTLSYIIIPSKTTVKLSAATKSSLKASWSKVTDITGYEVQYATANSFKGAKTVKANAKATSTTLKKLTKNKKYYVRVRSYKTVKVNGKNKTIYSAWSANKTLSTKKK